MVEERKAGLSLSSFKLKFVRLELRELQVCVHCNAWGTKCCITLVLKELASVSHREERFTGTYMGALVWHIVH